MWYYIVGHKGKSWTSSKKRSNPSPDPQLKSSELYALTSVEEISQSAENCVSEQELTDEPLADEPLFVCACPNIQELG